MPTSILSGDSTNVLPKKDESVPVAEQVQVGRCRKLITKEQVECIASTLFAFLGQVRDRFLYHVSDIKEEHVPALLNWILKQCDLNKDVEIDDLAQLTFPDIQLKSADSVFRLYVKIREGKAYCRGEESLTLNQALPEALDNIRHPYKSLEMKIDHVTQLLESESAFRKRLSHDD